MGGQATEDVPEVSERIDAEVPAGVGQGVQHGRLRPGDRQGGEDGAEPLHQVVGLDDALASQLRNAVPVLSEYGVTGLFFVMPAYQDGQHQYLGAAGIRALHDAGQIVGAHTCNHPSLPLLGRVAMMAELGAFYVPTFISLVQRVESANETHLPDAIVENLRRTIARGREVYRWARKHKVPVGFGTDLWGPDAQKSQLREFEMRQDLDTPADILRSATVTNAELLMEKGTLGTIAEGAYADLLIVEGNPLADLGVLMNPQKNLKFIMKDGVAYKNELRVSESTP